MQAAKGVRHVADQALYCLALYHIKASVFDMRPRGTHGRQHFHQQLRALVRLGAPCQHHGHIPHPLHDFLGENQAQATRAAGDQVDTTVAPGDVTLPPRRQGPSQPRARRRPDASPLDSKSAGQSDSAHLPARFL